MATLIIYYSGSGGLHPMSVRLQSMMKDFLVQRVDLRKNPNPDISIFRTIIIGCYLFNNRIHPKIRQFCSEYEDILMMKRVGMYVCHPGDHENITSILEASISPRLLNHTLSISPVGDEMILEKHPWYRRKLLYYFYGIKKSYSNLKMDNLKQFAQKMSIHKT